MSEIAPEKTFGRIYHDGYWETAPNEIHIAWVALSDDQRNAIEGGAQAVARAAIARRTDELDAQPKPAPESAKIIIVERDGHPARLFAAAHWEVLTSGVETGDLTLTDDSGECVAQVGARMWDYVCDAEAVLPADLYARQGKKLEIALDALRYVATSENADGERVAQALSEIAELDL